MSRRISIKSSADKFVKDADKILKFVQDTRASFGSHLNWVLEYAIIRLYRDFEVLILSSLKGAINNDPTTLSSQTGINFPRSLSDSVCEYLITRGKYFDFKGLDGLIKELKKYAPDTHYLLKTVTDNKYKATIEKLCAFRNYAAHDSGPSRAAVKKAINQERVGEAGTWLKSQNRFEDIVDKLKLFANEIKSTAPY